MVERGNTRVYTQGAVAKVMISLPEELLDRIDRAAAERQTSRSGFLRGAAERELGRPTVEEIERAMREGEELLADYGPFDSTQLIREDRDSRKY